ncbi:hypothetical protein M501DRAFT_1012841 [Patellaria atrata CBS 101060]|uniref:Uncharacterized protein n=1 Tax=Patellaria atrata CBS 101060 TaxID=1346257 RepID=A0A9P4SIC0_9PEZI|nr:hypothetical protein M501DRAFT_1012841 [Patellaria atrata CBS 101060]
MDLPVPEDQMEISSDIGRGDEDMDFQLDLFYGTDNDQEMAENPEAGLTLSGYQNGTQTYQEEELHFDDDLEAVDAGNIRDEDLADASELGQEDQDLTVVEDHPAVNTAPASIYDDAQVDHILGMEELSGLASQEAAKSVDLEPVPGTEVPTAQPSGDCLIVEHGKAESTHTPLYPEGHEDGKEYSGLDEQRDCAQIPAGDEPRLTPPQSDIAKSEVEERVLETDVQPQDSYPNGSQWEFQEDEHNDGDGQGYSYDDQDYDAQDHATSPTLSNVYLLTLIYKDNQISLFPQPDQDYFLQDASIVDKSIENFFKACREILGNTVTEVEQLDINIPQLGVSIDEDCVHAGSTSLSDILDVYTQLHLNDGNDDPGRLFMTLSTKTRFSSQLNELQQAVTDGKGISQVIFPGTYDGWEREEDETAHADNTEGQFSPVEEDPETEDPGEYPPAIVEDAVKEDEIISRKEGEGEKILNLQATEIDQPETESRYQTETLRQENPNRQESEPEVRVRNEDETGGSEIEPEYLIDYGDSDDEDFPEREAEATTHAEATSGSATIQGDGSPPVECKVQPDFTFSDDNTNWLDEAWAEADPRDAPEDITQSEVQEAVPDHGVEHHQDQNSGEYDDNFWNELTAESGSTYEDILDPQEYEGSQAGRPIEHEAEVHEQDESQKQEQNKPTTFPEDASKSHSEEGIDEFPILEENAPSNFEDHDQQNLENENFEFNEEHGAIDSFHEDTHSHELPERANAHIRSRTYDDDLDEINYSDSEDENPNPPAMTGEKHQHTGSPPNKRSRSDLGEGDEDDFDIEIDVKRIRSD